MAKSKITKKELTAYQEALKHYGNRENVTGVDIGYKYKDGKQLDSLAIRIHVREKFPESALEAKEIFPKSINEVPLDVIEAIYKANGTVKEPETSGIESLAARTRQLDPLQPGISVSHKNETAGTLGAIVIDNRSGERAILSNWHVLAGSSSASPGDEIIQPGDYDGGRVSRHTIANLERMILDHDGDAAIAILNNNRLSNPLIYDTSVFLSGLKDPADGDILMKSGRTTGVTYGKVDGLGRYNIDYSVGTIGIDGFKLVARTPNNPTNEEISSGGDSGAIWYDPSSNEAVGLHVAGETSPDPRAEHAIACYASRVFSRLDISLPTSATIEALPNRTEAMKMISSGLGAEIAEQIEKEVKSYGVEVTTQRLIERYPSFALLEKDFKQFSSRSNTESLTLAAIIGFATGAALRIAGKSIETESVSTPEELFSIKVAATAFIAGAISGTSCIDN